MTFKDIRNIASYIFILAIVIFAFVAILSIWEVFSNEVFTKTLMTLSIVSVSYVLITLSTLEREDRFLFGNRRETDKRSGLSAGQIIFYLFILWIASWMFSLFTSFMS